jgi:hypothetical protein
VATTGVLLHLTADDAALRRSALDDDGHDDNGGSDTDLIGSELSSGHGSHSAHDPNNPHDDNSKSGKKKRSAPVRKGVQGGDR